MTSGTGTLRYPTSATDSVHVTGRRVLATLIDAIILGAAYNVLVYAFGDIQHPRAWEWNGTLDNVLANIVYGIGVLLYFVLMEGYLGQTLGKKVTQIRVVREEDLGLPGAGAALIRTALRLVDGLLAYGVAFVAVLSTEKRQRLGDMAAHTLVVRT
jgi:uncharacterized RDD family membrane protein YckC